jgi:predicted SAM-dependent methyltransferase
MKIEVSNGEILDKYSILEIKLDKIPDKDKLKNIASEMGSIRETFENINCNQKVREKYDLLKSINLSLWGIEDGIREKEKENNFDDSFVQLARSVYITNDKRAEVKREINQMTQSIFFEEKSYKG